MTSFWPELEPRRQPCGPLPRLGTRLAKHRMTNVLDRRNLNLFK